MVEPLSSFQLPVPKDLEVVVIRLEDGTVVARARHEVETMEKAEREAK